MSILDLPYETQANPHMCGAAALAMAYRSYGLEDSQAEIWKRIATKDGIGRLCASSNGLARDAFGRGLDAFVVQAREPWVILECCVADQVRLIVNHRMGETSEAGHYSLVAGLDDERVLLHDPALGPFRSLTRDEFLSQWSPRYFHSDISGLVLIAISRPKREAPGPCSLCATGFPRSYPCPSCHQPIFLQPAAFLGCVAGGCPMRTWEKIFCTHCDFGWERGVPMADCRFSSAATESDVSPIPSSSP